MLKIANIKLQRLIQKLIIRIKYVLIKTTLFGSTPDFIIIGAQKSGTTSLFNYINLYSTNFKKPIKKEIEFFTQNQHYSTDFYRAHFPLNKSARYKTGEASPSYLFFPNTAQRIKKFSPNIKLVVILRDPVERAYSHFKFSMRKVPEKERINFDRALKLEDEIKLDADPLATPSKRFSYKARGLYAEQLQNWLEHFPKENFFFIETKELEYEPDILLTKLFNFLGLVKKEDINFEHLTKYNKNLYKPMATETENYLSNYFKKPNEKLFKLLGKNFPWK